MSGIEVLNQKGNTILLGSLLLFTTASWSLVYLKKEALLAGSLKSRLQTFICMKSLNREVAKHTAWMERLNAVIVTSNAATVGGLVNPAVAAAAKKTKRAAQAVQETRHFVHLKNLAKLSAQKCLFNPGVYKTPYQHRVLLARDWQGRAKLRRKKWEQRAFGKYVVLQTSAQVKAMGGLKTRSESWETPAALWLWK